MLIFNCTNIKSESPMFAKKFYIGGDGQGKSLRVALDKSPVAMDFRGGKVPSCAFLRHSAGPECLLTMEDAVLAFEFARPPALGERAEIEVEFFYEGESNG